MPLEGAEGESWPLVAGGAWGPPAPRRPVEPRAMPESNQMPAIRPPKSGGLAIVPELTICVCEESRFLHPNSRSLDLPRTRTWHLRLRRLTPYPLGQRAIWPRREEEEFLVVVVVVVIIVAVIVVVAVVVAVIVVDYDYDYYLPTYLPACLLTYLGTSSSSNINRPRGPMDKASASGAGDCRFESCRGH